MRLGNYERIPDEVRDHHETEIEALAGGYSYRQVLELVQNAADAILEHALAVPDAGSGRIVLRLLGSGLYAANTGAPLSRDGIVALLSARSSSKRENQIGRFGIGFLPMCEDLAQILATTRIERQASDFAAPDAERAAYLAAEQGGRALQTVVAVPRIAGDVRSIRLNLGN